MAEWFAMSGYTTENLYWDFFSFFTVGLMLEHQKNHKKSKKKEEYKRRAEDEEAERAAERAAEAEHEEVPRFFFPNYSVCQPHT